MKIRTKIIISLLLVVVVGGSVALFFTNKYSQEALKKSIGENSISTAHQIIDSVDRIIYRRIERWQSYVDTRPRILMILKESNEYFDNIENLQEIIELRDSQWTQANSEQANELMANWTDSDLSQSLLGVTAFYQEQYGFSLFPEVFITNQYGLNLAQTNKTSDYYQADEQWWQDAKDNGIAVTDAAYDESAEMYSISLCIRIDDEQDNFIGVLKAILNLKEIITVIDDLDNDVNLMSGTTDIKFNDSGFASITYNLINDQGRYIYSTNQSISHLENLSEELLELISKNQEYKYFVGNDEKNNNEEMLLSFATSHGYRDYQGIGWMFLVGHGTNEIYAPARALGQNILLVILGACFLSIVVGFIVSRIITKPIELLIKSAAIIRKGDLNHKASINSRDEIGEFSRAFDEMTKAIKKSRAEVDKKVEEQTKDIQRQKKRAERLAHDLKKFQLAVDNASDHIVITDSNGICIYMNTAVEAITGFTKNEIIGHKVGTKENWGGLMKHADYERLWKTIKEEKKSFFGELKNKKKNGQIYDAAVSAAPIMDDKGDVVFIVGIERDITKEKRVDQAKTEFVSLASHQLRTPLSAINWFAEMLIAGDAGKLNKQQKEYLKEIYDGNQRMVDLVNALLNVSRLELGTFMVEPVSTDIIKLAKSVLDELKPQIDEKRIKMKQENNTNIPKINVDPKLMRIVFQNLLSNAVKYTPQRGKVSITIDMNKKELKILVKDTGMGIPKSQHDRIFTKLFRADNVRESDTEGTGLGLYIVKAIIDQAKGKVWFESEEGQGTTFYVTLPLSGMKKKTGTKALD
ncbi:ATP-binding protein [Patescibacteria group bacterium]